MVEYDIINLSDKKIDEIKKIKEVIDHLLQKENVKNAIFNIAIVNNKEIRKINRKYRNIDKYTDVISFALEDHKDNIKSDLRVLGDIYISIDKAIEQKEAYEHSLLRELSFLSVHGLLHLLGYDHQTEIEENIMKEKTEVILNEKGISR